LRAEVHAFIVMVLILMLVPGTLLSTRLQQAGNLAREQGTVVERYVDISALHQGYMRMLLHAGTGAGPSAAPEIPNAALRGAWSASPTLMNEVALAMEAMSLVSAPTARQLASWRRLEQHLQRLRADRERELRLLAAAEQAALNSARSIAWLMLALFLCFSTLAVLLVRSRITRPFSRLSEQTRRLALGEFDPRENRNAFMHTEIREMDDALELIRARNRQLYQFATRDELTGLPNRRRAREWLEVLLRDGPPMHVVMVRMLNHSHISAVFGERVGDGLLAALAKKLRLDSRAWADMLAFYGGDVFLLVFHANSEASPGAELVQNLIRGGGGVTVSGMESTRPELAAGGASYPEHGETVDEILGQASTALERAGAEGDGSVRWAALGGTRQLRQQLDMHEAMRRAIADEQIEVWFQPVVDVGGGMRTSHVESLMRLRVDGQVIPVPYEMMEFLLASPDMLLPASERFFSMACESVLGARGIAPDLSLAFNLSASELREEHLDRLIEIIDRSALPADALTLEITERAALQAVDRLAPKLGLLRSQGARVVLDDFGTGYSSLSHLVQLPLDGIKIDRVFVQPLGVDEKANEIVAATIALARALNLEVIAEGVETPAQRDHLISLGCHLHQGFLYSKAMSPADLGTWLARNG
jgi:diguanylate cyclase (GGDEF)-like protein